MLRVSAGLALLAVNRAALDHWVLQFDGTCSQSGSSEVTCEGKALSQVISSFIDMDTGVDWSISEQGTGATAQLYIVSHGTSKGFDAEGNIRFMAGGPDQTPTTLNIEYNQDDVTRITHGSHFIEAGFANITGGEVGYEMAQGFLSLNINGEVGDGASWRAVVEAAVGHPNDEQNGNQQGQQQQQQGSQQQQQQQQGQQQGNNNNKQGSHSSERQSHDSRDSQPQQQQQRSQSSSHGSHDSGHSQHQSQYHSQSHSHSQSHDSRQ